MVNISSGKKKMKIEVTVQRGFYMKLQKTSPKPKQDENACISSAQNILNEIHLAP